MKGEMRNESEVQSDSRKGMLRSLEAETPWSYLFVHHRKADIVRKKLESNFEVFVHTSIQYRRGDKQKQGQERPTISGLIFVRGDGREVQNFLLENFPGLYLVKDCSTGCRAVISDEVMRSFMQISRFAPTRIRFMPHAFDYYSEGHALVRITSGSLSGLEGYRIRISRDKCLITSLGGMTVAIGGIHQESFENIEEYAQLRVAQQKKRALDNVAALSPLQAPIDRSFFNPESQMDVMAVLSVAERWLSEARQAMGRREYAEASEIALFVLEEMGSRFRKLYECPANVDLRASNALCRELHAELSSWAKSADVPAGLRENIEAGLDAIAIRFPFLPVPNKE